MGTPLVSVCIPTRDHGRYLGEAVASVLEQDVDGLEVLVHDDASTDDTAKLVEQLEDPRVHYRRHRRPLGVAENRNTCLAAARGRYVAWLDADDSYLPDSLARRLAVLEEHPEVGLVHGDFEVLDEDGAPLPAWPAPFDGDAIEPGATAFHELIASNEITTSTVVARRSCHGRFQSARQQLGLGDVATRRVAWRRGLHGRAGRALPPARRHDLAGSLLLGRAASL